MRVRVAACAIVRVTKKTRCCLVAVFRGQGRREREVLCGRRRRGEEGRVCVCQARVSDQDEPSYLLAEAYD